MSNGIVSPCCLLFALFLLDEGTRGCGMVCTRVGVGLSLSLPLFSFHLHIKKSSLRSVKRGYACVFRASHLGHSALNLAFYIQIQTQIHAKHTSLDALPYHTAARAFFDCLVSRTTGVRFHGFIVVDFSLSCSFIVRRFIFDGERFPLAREYSSRFAE